MMKRFSLCTNSKTIKAICISLLGSALLASGTASAATHKGQITFYHLNGDVAGRDACVRTVPAVPVGGGWACIYSTNPLRTQIATLLREAYEQGKECELAWTSTAPEGLANIRQVSCGSTQ